MPRGNPYDRRYNLVMHGDLWDRVVLAAEKSGLGLAEWWRQAALEALDREEPKSTKRGAAA